MPLQITHDPPSSLTSSKQHYLAWWRTLHASDLEQLLSLVPTKGEHKTREQLLYDLWRGIKALWCGITSCDVGLGHLVTTRPGKQDIFQTAPWAGHQIVRPLDRQPAFIPWDYSCQRLISWFQGLNQITSARSPKSRNVFWIYVNPLILGIFHVLNRLYLHTVSFLIGRRFTWPYGSINRAVPRNGQGSKN